MREGEREKIGEEKESAKKRFRGGEREEVSVKIGKEWKDMKGE